MVYDLYFKTNNREIIFPMFNINHFVKYLSANKYHITVSILLSILSALLIADSLSNIINILFLFLCLIFLRNSHIIVYTIVIIFLMLFASYGIAGYMYGLPNYSIVAAFFKTTTNESVDFIRGIDKNTWTVVGLNFLLIAMYVIINRKHKPTKSFHQKSMIVNSLLAIICFVFSNVYVTGKAGYYALQDYYKERNLLLESIKKPDSWQILANNVHKDYHNYVLILGESARKDYMSVYGYVHQNTPFLNQINGTIVDGVYTTAPNTFLALSRILQKTRDNNGMEIIPENNIITLANKAGLDTYWVSNPGFLGQYNSPTATISARAKEQIFLNKVRYSYDNNNDDDELLPKLETVLLSPNRKLIVVHLLGSHPHPCSRLHGSPVGFNIQDNLDINCYVTSLKKTDNFIKQVVEILKKQGDFSLIYFSDHALSVSESGVRHSHLIANTYEVPFVVLNSDDTEHRYLKRQFSLINFLDLYASWLGVKTNMTDDRFNIYQLDKIPEQKNIQVFDMQKMVDVATLPEEKVLE